MPEIKPHNSEPVPEELIYDKQSEQVGVTKHPEKLKAVIVEARGALEARARNIADAAMSRNKSELKGIGGLAKKIWVHNLFQSFYRQKEIAKAKQALLESQNLYAGEHEGAKEEDHQAAMEAIVTRFASEYDETIHGEAGEWRKVLSHRCDTDAGLESSERDQTIKAAVNDLILSYARGDIDEKAFAEQKVRIFSAVTTDKKREGDVTTAMEYADNLLEIAQQVRDKASYEETLENIDLDLDIVIGRAKAGVRTEAQFDTVDRIVEKLQKTKVGRLVNETTLAGGVAIAYSLGSIFSQRIARSKAAAVATFGGTALVGAGLAAAREGHRLEEERRQHARERAEGRHFVHPEKPRREEMEKFRYETWNAYELGARLEGSLYEGKGSERQPRKNISSEEITKAIAQLADIEARVKLSDTKSIDLISFSNVRNVESERTTLDIIRAQAKVDLRNLIKQTDYRGPSPYGEEEYGLPKYDFDKNLKELSQTTADSIRGTMGERDRAFRSMKHREMGKKALIAFGTGLVIGAGAQEIGAAFNPNQEGLVGYLAGHHNTASGVHYTMLRSFFGKDISATSAPHHLWEQGNLKVDLPQGYDLHPDGHGAFSLIGEGGKVINPNIHLNADGTLDDGAVAELAKHGISMHTGSVSVVEHGSTLKEVSADRYIADHQGEFHQIHRELWYGNDTPPPVFDKNELRGDLLLNKHTGSYDFSVARMTADGSYQTVNGVKLSADAHALAAAGKLKMLFSLSRGTQNRVIEVTIGSDFKAHVDPQSDIGKLLFRTVDGKPVCLAKFSEVAQTMGDKKGVEQVRLLATAVGKGFDSVKGQVGEDVTRLVPKTIVDMPGGHPFDLPPIIPLVGRTPLERENSEKGGGGVEYYDNESERLTKEGKRYAEDGSERLSREVVTTYDGTPLKEPDLKESRLSPEEVQDALHSMEGYLKDQPEEYRKLLESLNRQIGDDMGNEVKMSVVIPCYREGENIYRTLLGWTEKQKGVTPADVEFIVFVNSPNAETPIDETTLKEIERFQREHPEYPNVKVVRHQFDFEKEKTKMGMVYKVPSDLAVFRNLARLERGASQEQVAGQMMRAGGADAVDRNPRFLENLITFMKKYPETEQLRTQATYPPEVMEKFPLLHAYHVFRHGADALFTGGTSNQGLGTFRARIYAEAGGFPRGAAIAEEIALNKKIRSQVEDKGTKGIKKLLVKNAIDNPRRELFALVKGDRMLYGYKGYGKERETEMRDFDWEAVVNGSKKLTPEEVRNSNLTTENATREFDTLFGSFARRLGNGSIVSTVLEGNFVEKESLPASSRFLIQNDVLAIEKKIQTRISRGENIDRGHDADVAALGAALAKHLFDRTFRLALGLEPGKDYEYVNDAEGNSHVRFGSRSAFRSRGVDKLKKMSKKKWANFEDYWEE